MTRENRALTDRQRQVLGAIIGADGNLAEAARNLGCSQANAGIVAKSAGVSARLRGQRADAARSRLEADDAARDAARRETIAPTIDPGLTPDRADCHPARARYQLRLCRECYGERVARSRESFREETTTRARAREEVERDLRGENWRASTPSRVYARLSPQEERVLEIFGRGDMRNKDVATSLHVTEQTIKNHLSSIYKKLDCDNLLGAFVRKGWLVVPSGGTAVPKIEVGLAIAALDDAVTTISASRDALASL